MINMFTILSACFIAMGMLALHVRNDKKEALIAMVAALGCSIVSFITSL